MSERHDTESDSGQDGGPAGSRPAKPRIIHLFGREIEMPRSRIARIVIGVLLVLFGMVGFLPVLGFWMIPLGLLVLSYDIAVIRRLRRRVVVAFSRREKSG